MDDAAYEEKRKGTFESYEALCKRCGECCGALGSDPCSNLIKEEDGRYGCKVYKNRIGPQKTISGKMFICIAIRDVYTYHDFFSDCAYKKNGGE